jgi:ribonuclease HI
MMELEAINIALMQVSSIIRSFKEAVIFSDSAAARQSLARTDALPPPARGLQKFMYILNS